MMKTASLALVGCAFLLAGVAWGADPQVRLAREGQPAATIVLAAKPTQAAVLAAVELRDHVKKMSGATLPIVTDTAKVRGTRVLVGASAATEKLGLTNDSFKDQEYLIGTRGGDLVLMGRDGNAPYGLRVTGAPQWAEGQFGKALVLSGAGDGVVVTTPIGFDDAQGSMEMWINGPLQVNSTLFRIDGDPWSYHIVYVDKGRVTYTTYDGTPNGAPPVVSGELAPGWHHVLVTWDAAKNRKELFVDGKSAGTSGYRPTHCSQAAIQIGAIDFSGARGAFFQGSLDGVRISKTVRSPEDWEAEPGHDADTLFSMSCDEGEGLPHGAFNGFDNVRVQRSLLPDPYAGEGTCYAVYDFLEKYCGVRWYGPTEVTTVIPSRPTLTVSVPERRRAPSMPYRCVMPVFNYAALMPTVKGLWGNPTPDEMWVYLHRMRNGGEAYAAGHTFYGWADRFWHKNPKNEAAWEGQHLEWFAHGYEGSPTQLCYSSPEVIAQVVEDAREAFDGKPRYGAAAFGDYFGIGPGDDNRFCKCPVCKPRSARQDQMQGEHFTNGRNSDYYFTFCNAVARELRKTHPDKYLALLTYMSWTKHPSFPVEPNIAPELALAGNMFIDDPTGQAQKHIWDIYQEWVDKEPGRRIYLWLYPEFPESWVWSSGFTAFPGFGARLIAKQMKKYVKDGIRGIFPEGITTQLNEYMFNQLAFDADQDPEKILDEFFTSYYGAAAEPMRKLWLEIEEVYTSPASWPLDPQDPSKDVSITEATSWGRMGTPERMARWGGYMEQAKGLARTDIEKARVALFEEGEWKSMVAGAESYRRRSAAEPQREALRDAPPPTVKVPRIAAVADGDPAKADWSQAVVLTPWYSALGYPTINPINSRAAHDGKYLYLEFEHLVPAEKLVRTGLWGEDFELFFAAQRGHPMNQLAFGANGEKASYSWIAPGQGAQAWDAGAKLANDPTGNHWLARVSLPLATLLPEGVKPGGKFYANFHRMTSIGDGALSWSPNFEMNFHRTDRMGEFILE